MNFQLKSAYESNKKRKIYAKAKQHRQTEWKREKERTSQTANGLSGMGASMKIKRQLREILKVNSRTHVRLIHSCSLYTLTHMYEKGT